MSEDSIFSAHRGRRASRSTDAAAPAAPIGARFDDRPQDRATVPRRGAIGAGLVVGVARSGCCVFGSRIWSPQDRRSRARTFSGLVRYYSERAKADRRRPASRSPRASTSTRAPRVFTVPRRPSAASCSFGDDLLWSRNAPGHAVRARRRDSATIAGLPRSPPATWRGMNAVRRR